MSTAPSFGVPGSFSGGGNSSQFSNSHTDHYELQNFTTLTKGTQAIKFGAWLRDDREATTTRRKLQRQLHLPFGHGLR